MQYLWTFISESSDLIETFFFKVHKYTSIEHWLYKLKLFNNSLKDFSILYECLTHFQQY